jgi:hypothetical protein
MLQNGLGMEENIAAGVTLAMKAVAEEGRIGVRAPY